MTQRVFRKQRLAASQQFSNSGYNSRLQEGSHKKARDATLKIGGPKALEQLGRKKDGPKMARKPQSSSS